MYLTVKGSTSWFGKMCPFKWPTSSSCFLYNGHGRLIGGSIFTHSCPKTIKKIQEEINYAEQKYINISINFQVTIDFLGF